jgi:hypothetical protein
MTDVRATDEQKAIIERAASGASFKVPAYAGSGKTSTLVMVANACEEREILYLAFNRAAAIDAKAKFYAAGATNVRVRTAHALAYADVGMKYRARLETRSYAIRRALEEHFPVGISGKAAGEFWDAVMETIGAFESSADDCFTTLHVPERTNNAPLVLRTASEAWAAMANPQEKNVPLSHDTYFKVWALSRPVLKKFDSILFDEAQDASPVMLDVTTSQTHLQKIFVGDSHQSIYGWRGAMNALAMLKLPELPLTQSFRFGDSIAALANRILAVTGAKRPLRGFPSIADEVIRGVLPADAPLPDAILARTNAGLFGEAIGMLQAAASVGHTFGIVGGTNEVTEIVRGAYDLWKTGASAHPSIRMFRSWTEFTEASETQQGASYKPLVNIVSEHEDGIPELCAAIERYAVEPHEAQTVLSTLHKFKGQERPRVKVGTDFRPFCQQNKGGRYTYNEEEANVQYVAVTRAQKTLHLPTAFSDVLEVGIGNRKRMLAEARGVAS